jgi:hypothetical protein
MTPSCAEARFRWGELWPPDDHPAVASRGGAWCCQAARSAACSSRVTVGDLAGLPLLMSAPCSHAEQTNTRGSDAAVMPAWPQFGQVIRVNMRSP